jgi:hypothetical protein
MRKAIRGAALAALALSTIVFGTTAFADTVTYSAALNGPSEVPPTESVGTGTLTSTFDASTKQLTWSVTYAGLTGPATMAHFHGPADAKTSAPVLIPITGSLDSPISGSATLTDAEATDLVDGKLYFNIHTAAHKPGEIRGQIVKGQ